MRVSLRDFQLKPTAYLDKLPIELTRYGKVIAQVNVLTDPAKVLTDNKPKPESVNTKPINDKEVLTDKPTKTWGKCCTKLKEMHDKWYTHKFIPR